MQKKDKSLTLRLMYTNFKSIVTVKYIVKETESRRFDVKLNLYRV